MTEEEMRQRDKTFRVIGQLTVVLESVTDTEEREIIEKIRRLHIKRIIAENKRLFAAMDAA